ncbi:flagellar basal-body MS-ring/collar protein FliF [Chelatococcus sp. SYSU_G07232]|uniref:Flagellar M-ring protein n=1 Tax=Chelatococcus albus TaxID=3047466 RepID=A0ABT7AFH9_9HYPH|nr:flagellar basal-body MS-ring/collar protein FliF [Chelatococcus sp. SYSU_G07232]MDJ1158120.1 flagellar basal-body MS-ring/collar protein FliF [Chelatococcus sp. SYSU_G07232]
MNGALEILRKLGPQRLAAMGAVTLALIGFFAFVIMRMSQPAMGVLYTDLSFQDAGTIVRDLETRGIRYEARQDGQTILVPKNEIARLRMELAGKGLPSGGGIGYEIFDKGDAFSSTSFVQNINHLRALEGELARTIRSLSRVQSARVHLVMPERRLFEREREEPRASIVLKLAGELDGAQVRAIRHLAASAVQGLKPERISIVDERGRLLADGAQAEGFAGGIALDEKQSAIERRLRSQVEEIVAGVVGPGRARVQVAADLDTSRIESRSETFDPESRVVRSTQTRAENQLSNEPREGAVSVGNELPGANQQQQAAQTTRDASNKNEEIINYEISRTTRTEVAESGRIRRLSVAVLVDGVYAKDATGSLTYQPRPTEELERIGALVRTAIGFDKARGDQVEIVNLRFADGPQPIEAAAPEGFLAGLLNFTKDDLLRAFEMGVLAILTLVVLMTVVRPLVQKAMSPEATTQALLPGPAEGAEGPSPGEAALLAARESPAMKMLELAKANGQVQAQSLEKVGELVRQSPQETVAILRQWIHQS